MISFTLRERIRNDLNRWEAMFAWMYLDSEGLVTVGFGTMLRDANAATAVSFQHAKGGALATTAEITAAYDIVYAGSAAQKAAVPAKKYSAKHYEKVTDLRIALATASSLLDSHVDADYSQLQLIYPQFDSFPDDAKVALFDMIYNLGAGHGKMRHHRATGLRAYVTMNAAINRGDWGTAAKHCLRHGIPATRNHATAQLFNNCAVVKLGTSR
jgi:GH24 family phage-related lysozyme (muramidase)